jgi:drug/metabolite transporter (DMT)-like permease
MTTPQQHLDRGALLLMIATILLWSGAWIAMKMVVPFIGPFNFVALRYVAGGVVLLGGAACMRKPLLIGHWRELLMVAVTQVSGFQGLAQLALIGANVGKISLMAYTMPFWVVLLSWMILDERPTRRHGYGIVLAALGLVCVIEPWHWVGDTRSVLLGVGAGLSWALGTVLAKRMLMRRRQDVVVFTGWQMFLGGAAMIPVALAVPQIATTWNSELLLGLVYIVFGASALAWLFWLMVVRRLPATVAALSGLGVPITTVLFAWVLLAELPSLPVACGMVLILCGLFVVGRAAGQVRTAPARAAAGKAADRT